MAKKNTPQHNPKGKRPRHFYHYGSGLAFPSATYHETGWLKEYRRERSEWAAQCQERARQQHAGDDARRDQNWRLARTTTKSEKGA